jgi:hypothetical protein
MFSRTQVTNDDWGLVGSRQTVSVGLRSAVAESQPSIIHSTPDLRRSCLSSHAFACSGSQSIGPTPTVRKEDARMAQVLLPNTASGNLKVWLMFGLRLIDASWTMVPLAAGDFHARPDLEV